MLKIILSVVIGMSGLSAEVVEKSHNKYITTIDGLMYQNQPFTKRYSWIDAKNYCSDLILGGYDDWRLPTRIELKKLLTEKMHQGQQHKYYIRKEFVKNLRTYAWFWSATTFEKGKDYAWYLDFNYKLDTWWKKSGKQYALCVSKNSSRSSSRQSKQNEYSATKQPSKSSTNIFAVPFSPVIDGVWIDQNKKWNQWSETILKNQVKKSISIESVRIIGIPFYSTTSRKVVLVEAAQSGRAGTYYILTVIGENTHVVLSGNGSSIHKMNTLLGLSIDTAKEAESYLKFFTSSISSDDGIFFVLESNADYLSKKIIKEIDIRPIQVDGNKKKGWTILADVIHGNGVYEAKFLVHRSGHVKMLNDSLKKNVPFSHHVVINKGRRYYISQ